MTEADIGAKIGEIIADAREAGVSDEAIITKLTEVIEALKWKGYLDFGDHANAYSVREQGCMSGKLLVARRDG
jgi:hypothetical protein